MNIKSGEEYPIIDPELLESQIALRDICNEIYDTKPDEYVTPYWYVDSGADPFETETRLRNSSVSDLMLQEGDSLSMPNGGDRYPDLDLFVGNAVLTKVTVMVRVDQYQKMRIIDDGTGPPYDVYKFDGENDWRRKLCMVLHYSNKQDRTATQTIAASTGSNEPGQLPDLSRDIRSSSYAEMGYDGHNQKGREAHNDEEVLGFVALARELTTK
jgi:hypothetical protein